MPSPCTESFDWIIYRDATLAGLAALIPAPYIDSLIEQRLRGQMVRSIATRRGKVLDGRVIDVVNRTPVSVTQRLKGMLIWPFTFPLRWLYRLSRKFLYALTMRQAVNTLSHYWRRAFLLDHAVCAGHLDTLDRAGAAAAAMRTLLAEEEPDSLLELALEGIRTIPDLPDAGRRAWQILRESPTRIWDRITDEDGARTDEAPGADDTRIGEIGRSVRTFMGANWARFAGYFDELAKRYDAEYHRQLSDAHGRELHGATEPKARVAPPAGEEV